MFLVICFDGDGGDGDSDGDGGGGGVGGDDDDDDEEERRRRRRRRFAAEPFRLKAEPRARARPARDVDALRVGGRPP